MNSKAAAPTVDEQPRVARRRGRPSRLSDVIAEASAEFNRYGILGASFDRIGLRVGVARASLYNYFSDRSELLYRCYKRECEVMEAQLAAARIEGHSGLDRVVAFVRMALDETRPVTTSVQDLWPLNELQRREIEFFHGANVLELQTFIDEGVRDGSVQPCSSQILAQCLLGITSWLPVADGWHVEGVRPKHSADVVSDFVTYGFAKNRRANLSVSARFAPNEQQGSAFDRALARAAKREEFLAIASRLFLRQGIDGVPLQQIVEEAGTTTGAFYHYFKSKNQLVMACYERGYRFQAEFLQQAQQATSNGLEAVLTGMHLGIQAYGAGYSPLPPLAGLDSLPSRSRQKLIQLESDLTRSYVRTLAGATEAGLVRKLDPVPALLSTGGAVIRLARWMPRANQMLIGTIADEATRFFAFGLARHGA